MPTDRQTLVAVLSLPPGKLSQREKTIFTQWLDTLDAGVIALTKGQRKWVDDVFVKNELDKGERPPPKPLKGRIKNEQPLDKMPKPLKPPGRK
jgi:hypothetical protein